VTSSSAATPPASGSPMDDEEVCGETYDHDLMLVDERDGEATYECRVCGAEVLDEPEDDPECE
jgi:hypothetical protein